jgi:hypothetical protein
MSGSASRRKESMSYPGKERFGCREGAGLVANGLESNHRGSVKRA